MNPLICEAIRARRLLIFGYGDRVPVVEPHAYGLSSAEHEVLSAWLRPGHSRGEPEGGWRTYRVDQMRELQMLDERFDGPRAGYNPDDARMLRVFCRIERGGILARLYGLSPRERDVLARVVRGESTKQIAAALGLSAYTVQDHVDSACIKVGVRGRRALVAKLFFDGQPDAGRGDPVLSAASTA